MKTEYLLMLQLFFNLLVIAALITLRKPGRAKAPKVARRRSAPEQMPGAATNENTQESSRKPERQVPPEGIADLVQEVNKRELAAEQALRSRLAHFRAREAQ